MEIIKVPADRVKGISVLNPDMLDEKYLMQTVDYAIKYGFTHFQLIGPIHKYGYGNIDGMTNYRKYSQFNYENDSEYVKLNERVVNQALEKLNEAGIKSYQWHHELDLPTDFDKQYPEILNENGDIEVTHPLVKDFLENKIIDFFFTYPKMDGIILTLHETKVPLLKLKNQKLGKVERVKYVTKILYDICNSLGKELIVRPFASIEEDYQLMLNAYEEISNKMWVMDKWTQFDWSLVLPSNKFFNKIKNNPLFVETDISGEYFGKNRLPIMLRDHIIEKVKYCEQFNPVGYVHRIDRNNQRLFGTVNQVNLDIAYASLANLDIDKAIDDFFAREYPDCAQELRSIMESTQEINKCLLQAKGYYFMQGSYFPQCNHSKNHFFFELMKKDSCIVSNEWFIPVDWVGATNEQFIEEKDWVLEQATQLLARVKKLEGKMSDEKYLSLITMFKNLFYCAQAWRTLVDVLIFYVKYFETKDQKYEASLFESFNKMLTIKKVSKEDVGDTKEYYFSIGGFTSDKTNDVLGGFVKDVKQSFEVEKQEFLELEKEGLYDYIICGGACEGHKLQKEVNFSDTLVADGKLCRVPGNNGGAAWSRINAHGWFSYELKVKPNSNNAILIEAGSNSDIIDFMVSIDGKDYLFNQPKQDKNVFQINYEAKENSSVRIRIDRRTSHTPYIYTIKVV